MPGASCPWPRHAALCSVDHDGPASRPRGAGVLQAVASALGMRVRWRAGGREGEEGRAAHARAAHAHTSPPPPSPSAQAERAAPSAPRQHHAAQAQQQQEQQGAGGALPDEVLRLALFCDAPEVAGDQGWAGLWRYQGFR